MDIRQELLHRLLDQYERSGHCLPGKTSNRRIAVSLNETDFPAYRQNRRESVEEINAVIQKMEEAGFVTFQYRKGYEGWLIDKVYLNLESLSESYQAAGRRPLALHAKEQMELLDSAYTKCGRAWVRRFIADEQDRLRKHFRASRLLPEDARLAKDFFMALQASEKGPQLMRVLSVQCFQDSKRLERELLPFLLSVARRYEPDIAAFNRGSDEKLTDNEVLAQIGILRYPEIFEFCGDITLTVQNISVFTSPFSRGFCLQSETLPDVQNIDLDRICHVYFVENRTNYRALVLKGIPPDVLVIHHGGFYSPARGCLFQKVVRAAKDDTRFYFWGDLDLGGFQMLERLRKNIVPNLLPFRMDDVALRRYRSTGKPRTADYLHRLEQFRSETSNPSMQGGIAAIMQTGVTVEQESMLDADITL